MTQCTCQSHANVNPVGTKESFATSCHVQSYQDLKHKPYGS